MFRMAGGWYGCGIFVVIVTFGALENVSYAMVILSGSWFISALLKENTKKKRSLYCS